MDPQQLLAGDEGRFDMAQHEFQPRRHQLILDGRQACRALGVSGTRVVASAVGMGKQGDGHGRNGVDPTASLPYGCPDGI